MSNLRVEWANGPDLAEEAEAIGIKTDQIMGAHERPYGLLVLWTPEPMDDDETEILGTLLERDDDQILRVVRTASTGETIADLRRSLESSLKKRGPW